MRKFNKIAFLFFFLSFPVIIQAQDFPKTIYELYDLPDGGCEYALDKSSKEKIGKGLDLGRLGYRKKDASMLQKIMTALEVFSKAVKAQPNILVTHKKILKNGSYCFLEKGKWGLKNAKSELIIAPIFDFIALDTFSNGFVGYQESLSNYYDAVTGKKRFENDYYSIKSVGKETFIVQSKEGYNLIRQGKNIILSASSISKMNYRWGEKPDFYYYIKNKEGNVFGLSSDYTSKIPISNRRPLFSINKSFILFKDNLYNLKTKKDLLCEKGFSLRLIDKQQQLLSIKKGRNSPTYLIDFDGNILLQQSFSHIHGSENKMLIARTNKTIAAAQGLNKTGLMTAKGNWIIAPKYNSIISAGKYYIVKNADGKIGMIDINDKIILPIQYDFINNIKDNHFLCGFNDKKEVNSKIISIPSGKIIKDKLQYKKIRNSKSCNGDYYIAYIGQNQEIINENYEPITPLYDYISFEKPYLIGKIHNAAQSSYQYKLYNCDGKQVHFTIEDEKQGLFTAVKKLNKNLIYIRLTEESAYLIPAKGKPIPFGYYVHKVHKINFGNFIALGSNHKNTWGIIDENGTTLLPFIFKNIKSLPNNTQLIQFTTADNRKGLFNVKGNLINDRLYSDLKYLKLGLHKVQENSGRNKKWGLINDKGETILPIKYDSIYLDGGLIFTKKGENTLIFDRTGKLIK